MCRIVSLIILIVFELSNVFGQNDCLIDHRFDHLLSDTNSILSLGGSIDLVSKINHIQYSKSNFEFRFYSEGRINGSLHEMIQLKCVNGELKAKKYKYKDYYTVINDSVITNFRAKIINENKLTCKIPLVSFVDSLIAHQFLTLPSMSKKDFIITDTVIIDGMEIYRTSMPLVLDGSRYIFQYKIGQVFYTFRYENPESYLSSFPKNKNLIQVTEIIRFFREYLI